MEPRSQSRARVLLNLFTVALLAGVCALLVLSLLEGRPHALGPATVTVRPKLGSGITYFAIPPLGTVSAKTHSGPLSLTATLTKIDFSALSGAVDKRSPRDALVDDVERDLRRLVFRISSEWLVVASIAGALVGALWPRRRLAHVAAGAVGGIIATGASIALIVAAFDVEAFREPAFSGTLRRAPEVIRAAEAGLNSLDDLRSRYETLADRVSRLLALVANPASDPDLGGVAILHISDVHSNPLGLEIANQLARSFSVDAVIDTGDLTSFGEPIEAQLRRLIREIPVPYLFVAGNHDSLANRSIIAKVRNVKLLDSDTARIGDVIVLGVADPTFTASGDISTEEGNQIRLGRSDDVASVVDETAPDVLAVHDIRLASESIGRVPVVLAGHTHEGMLEEDQDTALFTVGSTGATGLGAFTAEADMSYEAEILYFRDQRLIALDYVSLHGLGDDFEVQRKTFETIAP